MRNLSQGKVNKIEHEIVQLNTSIKIEHIYHFFRAERLLGIVQHHFQYFNLVILCFFFYKIKDNANTKLVFTQNLRTMLASAVNKKLRTNDKK